MRHNSLISEGMCRFFGIRNTGAGRRGRKTAAPKKRLTRLESLEGRRLLSISAAEYAGIIEAYPDFALPTVTAGALPTTEQLNIIEIDSANLSLANLKSAIDTAGTTTQPDLIVVRTTDTANTIEYATTADAMLISFNAQTYGSLSIVGLGTQRLTLDANKYCRVMNITQGTVNLGTLMITGGKTGGAGGGIYSSGTLAVTNCTISGNTAPDNDGAGGGIYSSGTLTVTNSTISGNTASDAGGGIYNEGSNSSLTVTNSMISGNTASYGGGGIYSSDTLTVTNSTISGNTVSDGGGGGVYCEDSLTANNTIVAQNYGGDLLIDVFSGNHNLIGGDPEFVEAPEFDADGKLTNAETMDLQLAAGSLAIDHGDNSLVTPKITTDLVGNPRMVRSKTSAATVDIGAYEYQETISGTWETPSTVVTTTEDTLNDMDGRISLREAIFYAAARDTVTFYASLAGSTFLLGGLELYLTKDISINATSVWDTVNQKPGITLDAGQKSRVIYVGGSTVNLTCLMITSGNSVSDSGGGIYSSGTLTVTNSTISGNTAYYGGGGIYSSGTLTVTNSTISGNTATYGGGGGIYSYGTLTVTNSTISGNTAYYGGGICNFGTLTVMNSTISGNTAIYGGGIYSKGTLTVMNGTISGNTAFDGDGGGIWNSGKATVVNSIVSGNYAGGSGGGFNSTGEQTLINSTVAGNQSKNTGGGVCNNRGTVIANNTIIAMNVSSVAPDLWTKDYGTTQTTIDHSLIGNGACGNGQEIEKNGINLVGSEEYPVDPLFESFGTYTTWSKLLWKSWNLRPRATSPVIDSGSDDLAVDGDGEELIVDRDGNSRISGNGVDIGAYELPHSPSLFPGLKQPTKGYTVAENAKLNSNVGSVTPITQAARGQAYSYALTSGNEYFAIDSQGKITTIGMIDYETTPTIDIVVETLVNGVLTWSDSFTVNAKDVNEVPVDIGISKNGNVVSDIDFNEGAIVVGTLAATDPDGTAITGYKLGGNDAKLFEVVKNGDFFELRAKSPLDFENPLSKNKTNRYEVEIQATDSTRETGKSKLAIHVINRDYTSEETVEIASSGNAWVLKQVGSNVQILNGKTVLFSEPASAFPSLIIHGNAKKDTLTWDPADWNSSTKIDVTFDGQGDADTVKITGTDARETFFFTSHGVTVNGTSIGLTNVEMLTVDGGNGDDTYRFTGLAATTSTTVSDKNGVDTFDFSDAQSGVTLDIGNTKPQSLFGCTLVVKTAPEILIGTEYADTLTGNKSGSVIYGGTGSDTIRAVGGKNVLIGGMAADAIYGSGGEDLLIGGDINRDLLPELYQEWVASKSKWAARCDQLRQGIFSSEAIENDDCDTLYGGKGQDWFFGEDEEIQDFDETSRTPDRKN